jgi:hypothetical protein
MLITPLLECNAGYLETKRKKMGHILTGIHEGVAGNGKK